MDAYDKKIKLVSIKLFIKEEEENEIDATPTETPSKGDELSIGNSFESASSIIELTEKGFIDGENFVQVNDDGKKQYNVYQYKSATIDAESRK